MSAFFISLWGGSIRFNVPMLFATAFLPMFGIGGLTGIPLAFNSADLYLHDTYYVIAHFHYIVAPGTIFAAFRRHLFLVPESDRAKDERVLGQGAFLAFAHLHERRFFCRCSCRGWLGMHRRWYDGGQGWNAGRMTKGLGLDRLRMEHADLDCGAWIMGLAQIPFIINFFWSIKHGEKVNDNPWEATTLEWTAPSPPPHGNFATTPVAYRGPYEYSLPGRERDFTMQNEPMRTCRANASQSPRRARSRLTGL